MPVDLMDLVKTVVQGQIGSLSAILGDNEENTNSAVDIALPAILGGLLKKSATPTGADEVYKSLDDHDGRRVDALGELLNGGNHSQLLAIGTRLLGMLFGDDKSEVSATISSITGQNGGTTDTLLGILTPVAMGIVGRQRRADGLDATGVADLLSSQEPYLSGRMPPELVNTLGLGDTQGATGHSAPKTSDTQQTAVSHATPSSAPHSAPSHSPSSSGGSLVMTFLPLLVLVVLGMFGYSWWLNNAGSGGGSSVDVSSLPDVKLPGFDKAAIGQSFSDVMTAVGSARDAQSATSALPQITEATKLFDEIDLSAIAGSPAKESAGELFSKLLEQLQPVLDKAYAIPGVRDVLEPVMTEFVDQFSVLGN